MTLQDAIDRVDEMKANMMSVRMKVGFLTEIDQMIHDEIVMKHIHTEEQAVKPAYDEEADLMTELIVPDPYGRDVYLYWLMSRIDDQNQEDGRYNVDRVKFENAYRTMADWWTRTHMPVQRNREIRI